MCAVWGMRYVPLYVCVLWCTMYGVCNMVYGGRCMLDGEYDTWCDVPGVVYVVR